MDNNSTGAPDDLQALRTILETLKPFDGEDQHRIIRWASEKLGIKGGFLLDRSAPHGNQSHPQNQDAKSFVVSKNPQSHNQLAAIVAYYYKFEAPLNERKDAINADDILNVCRLAGLARPKVPGQTLLDAHSAGFLNKGADRGTYQINSVGENLVAVSLPSSATSNSTTKKQNKKHAK